MPGQLNAEQLIAAGNLLLELIKAQLVETNPEHRGYLEQAIHKVADMISGA